MQPRARLLQPLAVASVLLLWHAACAEHTIISSGPLLAQEVADSAKKQLEATNLTLAPGFISLAGTQFPGNAHQGAEWSTDRGGASQGMLTISSTDPTHPEQTVLDAAMRSGLISSVMGPSRLILNGFSVVNLCEQVQFWNPAYPSLTTALGLALFNHSRVDQGYTIYNMVLYLRPSDIGVYLYVQGAQRSVFNQMKGLTATLVSDLPSIFPSISSLGRHHVTYAQYNTPYAAYFNMTLRSIYDPDDPLLIAMRANGTLMPPQYCNGTLLPQNLAAAEYNPSMGPVWLADNETEWVADLSQQAAFTRDANNKLPGTVLLLGYVNLGAVALPSPGPYFNNTFLLSGPFIEQSKTPMNGVINLAGAVDVIRMGPAAQLFSTRLTWRGLAQQVVDMSQIAWPVNITDRGSDPAWDAKEEQELDEPEDTDHNHFPAELRIAEASRMKPAELKVKTSLAFAFMQLSPGTNRFKTTFAWLNNCTIMLPEDDYLALVSLVHGDNVSMCVNPVIAVQAAKLKLGIDEVDKPRTVVRDYGRLALDCFEGFGMRATAITFLPEELSAAGSRVIECMNVQVKHCNRGQFWCQKSPGLMVAIALGGVALMVGIASCALLIRRIYRYNNMPLAPPPPKPPSLPIGSAGKGYAGKLPPSFKDDPPSDQWLARLMGCWPLKWVFGPGECPTPSYASSSPLVKHSADRCVISVQDVNQGRGGRGKQEVEVVRWHSNPASVDVMPDRETEQQSSGGEPSDSDEASAPEYQTDLHLVVETAQQLTETATNPVNITMLAESCARLEAKRVAQVTIAVSAAASASSAGVCMCGSSCNCAACGSPSSSTRCLGTCSNQTAGTNDQEGLDPPSTNQCACGSCPCTRPVAAPLPPPGAASQHQQQPLVAGHLATGSTTSGSELTNSGRQPLKDSVDVKADSLGVKDANKVTITGVLGKGSWGNVFKGQWKGLPVALKTLVFEDSPVDEGSSSQGSNQAAAAGAGATRGITPHNRAIMEASIAASVGHRNMVCTYHYDVLPVKAAHGIIAGGNKMITIDDPQLLELGQEGRAFKMFLVQELCATTLSVALKLGTLHHQWKTLEVDQLPLLVLLLDIATGLEYLHSKGIIHGDLKPDNVLLKADPCSPSGVVAKLADFGLSTRIAEGASHVSNFRSGTAFYVAPEVVMQYRTSTAADIYSFGVVMWQAYSGCTPYLRDEQGVFTRNPDFPTFKPPYMPSRTYLDLVYRCLQPDPKMRPTAAQLCQVLTTKLHAHLSCLRPPVTSLGPASPPAQTTPALVGTPQPAQMACLSTPRHRSL